MKSIFGLILTVFVSLTWISIGLAQSGHKVNDMPIRIQVIGFDIKKGSAEEKQLTGIARKGGGSYYPASNAEELNEVLKATVEKVIRGSTPPPPPPPPPKPQPRVSEDTWQSIRKDKSSSTELTEEPLERRKKPKGHSTKYGF